MKKVYEYLYGKGMGLTDDSPIPKDGNLMVLEWLIVLGNQYITVREVFQIILIFVVNNVKELENLHG